MSFDNIIGNNKNKQFLYKMIELNNIGHSYMFEGIEGIGKYLFAKQFAKMILCTEQDKRICRNCKSCIEFASNNNPDFIEINPDGKVIKIDQIRKMQEKIIEKPIISNKKVYIINDADLMTKEAQNCLLKTLEEPPKYIVIILVLSNENKILNTVKSRCMKIYFNRLNKEELQEYAIKNFNKEEINENIIQNCDGSISKLINIKDNIKIYDEVENLIQKFETDNILDIINNADILYKSKDNIEDILDYMITIFYNILMNNKNKFNYINIINIIEDVKQRLKANNNFDMSIDHLIFKIWEEINENSSWCKI